MAKESSAKAIYLFDSSPLLLELSHWIQCRWFGKLWKDSCLDREPEIFSILSLKMCFWKSLAPAPLAAQIIFIVTLGIYLTLPSHRSQGSFTNHCSPQFTRKLLSSSCPDSWSEELCSEPQCSCSLRNYIVCNKTKQSYLDSVWTLLW